jgi:hypothetical protein
MRECDRTAGRRAAYSGMSAHEQRNFECLGNQRIAVVAMRQCLCALCEVELEGGVYVWKRGGEERVGEGGRRAKVILQ